MVEILQGAGHCDRVLTSHRIVYPKLEGQCVEGKCLMVLSKGNSAKTLKSISAHGILNGASYEEVKDDMYLVDQPENGHLESVGINIGGNENRVFFMDCSSEHEGHWGRCTADGFSCGTLDSDVWQKILECSGQNPCTVSRSYHMDCEPNWVCDEKRSFSEEQQAMLEFGLPLTFGQRKDFSRVSDDAVVVDSCMIEKDYDKECAELSSSTERMSVSRSPHSANGEILDEMEPFLFREEPAPGSLSEKEFQNYWIQNGERLVSESWRETYAEYITDNVTEENQETNFNGVFLAEEGFSQSDEMTDHEDVDKYGAAWEKLWQDHAWQVYLKQMIRFVKEEGQEQEQELEQQDSSEGIVRSSPNGMMNSEEGTSERQGSEDDASQPNEETPLSSGKRPFELPDFGLVANEGSCSILARHIRNHKLKKIKRESHHHKRIPFSVSADALEDAPKDARLAKYWAQRYRLFRKFDKGVRLNETAWFSVTPEKIAEHIAARMCPRAVRKSNFVVDAFCGVGGNTVQLALRAHSVLAIDNDRETIEMAKHNAGVYAVENKIDFVLADMNTFLPRIPPDATFMSPPWGGPEYKDKPAFDLADMEVDFVEIFHKWKQLSPNMTVILPRNTKVDQLCALARVEIEQNLLNKKIKTITAYYGNLICK